MQVKYQLIIKLSHLAYFKNVKNTSFNAFSRY